MKVLYTFYHGAAFAWSLVHKLSVHLEDDAYLLVADGWDWCVGKPKLLLLLHYFVEQGIFKEVYTYDNGWAEMGVNLIQQKSLSRRFLREWRNG